MIRRVSEPPFPWPPAHGILSETSGEKRCVPLPIPMCGRSSHPAICVTTALLQGVDLQLRLIFSLYVGSAAVLLDDMGPRAKIVSPRCVFYIF